jgi:glutaryl-CoA dehydrogenase
MSNPAATDSTDFYAREALLEDDEQPFLHNVRDSMKSEVQPTLNHPWQPGTFPTAIVNGYPQRDRADLPFHGFGLPGRSFLLDGMVTIEPARTDPSVATFVGVRGGLAMGSIYLCGNDEKRRYLPEVVRFDVIGEFGLTEPDVGSGAAGGLNSTARRDGDSWVINGQKKWISNASFSDVTIIWAHDVADVQVKGFVVANDTPGFATTELEGKIALRVVQNAQISLSDVRVTEPDPLQSANSFRDTAEVLRMTRAGVSWMAGRCARGAYKNALSYSVTREQFGRDIAGFQRVGDLLVRMLGNITSWWSLCARLSQLQGAGTAEHRYSSPARTWCTVRMGATVGYAREFLAGNPVDLTRRRTRWPG